MYQWREDSYEDRFSTVPHVDAVSRCMQLSIRPTCITVRAQAACVSLAEASGGAKSATTNSAVTDSLRPPSPHEEMVSPFLVTVPFGDADQAGKSDERQAYENKVMDILLAIEEVGPSTICEEWYFYPYRNPNPRGQALTPQQLHDLLKNEFDFFPSPVRSRDDLAGIMEKRLRFRQPSVPPYRHHRTGEVLQAEGSDDRWEDISPTGIYILDDPECRYVRFLHMEQLDCEHRFRRKFEKDEEDAGGVGQGGSGSDNDKSDNKHYLATEEEEAIHAVRQGKDPLMESFPYPYLHVNAVNWLDIPLKDAFMYGIEATFIPIEAFYGYNMRAFYLGHFLCEFLDDWEKSDDAIERDLQESWKQLQTRQIRL